MIEYLLLIIEALVSKILLVSLKGYSEIADKAMRIADQPSKNRR
ncbi:hypothetical protein [Lysinibacillus sp. NPDC056232]